MLTNLAFDFQFRKNLPPAQSDHPTDDDSDFRSSPALRIRKSNPVLNAIAARKQLTPQSTPVANKKDTTNAQLDAKRSALSAALKQKLNTSAPGPQTERIAKPQNTKSISANCTPLNTPKLFNKNRPSSTIQADSPKPRKPVVEINPDDLEDFEQMPTFTIVNINDIINQKEDVVVLEKKKGKSQSANQKEDVDFQPDTESTDDDDQHSIEDTKIVNRRKTYTKNLSQKSKLGQAPKSSPPPKLLNNTSNQVRPLKNAIKQNGLPKGDNKSAPRILNSTLCRNTGPTVEPRVLNDSINNNNVSANSRSKENNVVKSFPNSRVGQLETKLPQTKTVISHQVIQGGTRRVRKITCFETWFVIKLPNEEQPVYKAELTVNLIQLGNNISSIPLPSDKWSYTISLLRKKPKINRSTSEEDDLVYTGEVQDSNINPNDRHLYVPSNVMFRRKSQNPSLRMQFDRAIILKNKTFYINIEGKNVKLLAAPTSLQSLTDIETLLQIVNEVSLHSPLVEQTNYVV